MESVKKYITAERALSKLMALCSRAEKSTFDVRRLLDRYGVGQEKSEQIIDHLTSDGFLSDRRYAEAFVKDKVSYSGWGAKKIVSALYEKRISREIIVDAIAVIEKGSETEKIETLLIKKAKTIKSKDSYDLRSKLLRFALSRGFEYEDSKEVIDKMTSNQLF